MTPLKSAASSSIFKILLFALTGVLLVLFVVWSQSTWGISKGTAFAALWVLFIASGAAAFFIPAHIILTVFALISPFLLRLNITGISFEILNVHFFPFFLAELYLTAVLMIRLFIEKSPDPDKTGFSIFVVFYSAALMSAGGFCAAILTNSLIGGNTKIAMISIFGQIIIPTLIFALVFFTVKPVEHIRRIYSALFIGMVLNALIGIGTFFSSMNFMDLLTARLPFNFVGPNTYAAIAVMFIPAGILMAGEATSKLLKIVYIAMTLVLVGSVFLTISRGGALSLLLTLILLFVFSRKFRPSVGAVFIIILIMLIIASPFLINVISRFENMFSRTKIAEMSTLIRLSAWQASLRSLIQYPLGIGGNQFPIVYSSLGRFPDSPVLHSHHIFLGMAVEYGIPALIGFIAIIFIIFQNAFSRIRSSAEGGRLHSLTAAIMCGLFGSVFMSIISEGPRCHLNNKEQMFNDALIFMYIVMALLFRLSQKENNEKE